MPYNMQVSLKYGSNKLKITSRNLRSKLNCFVETSIALFTRLASRCDLFLKSFNHFYHVISAKNRILLFVIFPIKCVRIILQVLIRVSTMRIVSILVDHHEGVSFQHHQAVDNLSCATIYMCPEILKTTPELTFYFK